jgi:hypothetical protein
MPVVLIVSFCCQIPLRLGLRVILMRGRTDLPAGDAGGTEPGIQVTH